MAGRWRYSCPGAGGVPGADGTDVADGAGGDVKMDRISMDSEYRFQTKCFRVEHLLGSFIPFNPFSANVEQGRLTTSTSTYMT